MNIIMKLSDESPTGIRGTLKAVESVEGRWVIHIGQISAKGLMKLEGARNVKVEVLGMPSRVMFVSRVLQRTASSATMSLPRQLISIERRQNTRYPTTLNHMAFFQLNDWNAREEDLAAPPVYQQGFASGSWIGLADLSLGGACLLTHFRSVLTYLDSADEVVEGKIIFPMAHPIEAKVHVRWQKKTVNRIVENGIERARLEYRFGIEFGSMDEEVTLKVRQFMRRLSMAQAI